MRVLYHQWLSPFSRKVRIVLRDKNLDFTLKTEKTWERRPEFLALNPSNNSAVAVARTGTLLVPLDKADLFRSNLEANDKPRGFWGGLFKKRK